MVRPSYLQRIRPARESSVQSAMVWSPQPKPRPQSRVGREDGVLRISDFSSRSWRRLWQAVGKSDVFYAVGLLTYVI